MPTLNLNLHDTKYIPTGMYIILPNPAFCILSVLAAGQRIHVHMSMYTTEYILRIKSWWYSIILFSFHRKLRGHLHRQLLISLSFALLGLYITFIITNAVSSYPDILPSIRPICGLLSALLHYFFLVTFLTMAAIAINLYRKLVVVFNADIPSYLPIAILICWGM